jgi:hypothetical protein
MMRIRLAEDDATFLGVALLPVRSLAGAQADGRASRAAAATPCRARER